MLDLRRWSTVPAVTVATWLALMTPLPALGVAGPVPALLAAAVAAVVATGVARRAAASERRSAPDGRVAVLVLGAAGSAGVVAALTAAEHVVLRRDAGSYALIGQWLATTGQLVVPDALAAVGGPAPDVTAASPAFFAAGGDLVPQFLVGPHLAHAAGYWVAGWAGLFAVPAVLAGLALVAVGGLVSRLVGGWWPVVAVVALGVCYPVLHVARAPYSEPLAMLLLFGGLCLLLDARRTSLAFAAGAVLGLGTLVRVDVLREVALLVPILGWLALRGQRVWQPAAAGLAAGCALGAAAGLGYARPYLADIASSLVPLAVGLVLLVAIVAVAVPVLRRRRRTLDRAAAYLPVLAPVAAAGVLLALATRPLWLVERGAATTPAAGVVAGLQLRQGMPLDPGRTYAEQSVTWLSWWLGWPTLVLAAVGAVALARAVGTGRAVRWVAPYLVVLGSSVLTLWRPAITPDHPWADRRLVPVVLPGVVLLAVWTLAAALRRVPRRAAPLVAVAGVLALVLPAAVATAPLLRVRTEQGELAAVRRACAALGPREVALLVDGRAAREWPQPLRGVCGVPAVTVVEPSPAVVRAVGRRARAQGWAPVLVAAEDPALLGRLGAATVEQVLALDLVEDARLLTRRPSDAVPLDVDLWVGRPR